MPLSNFDLSEEVKRYINLFILFALHMMTVRLNVAIIIIISMEYQII